MDQSIGRYLGIDRHSCFGVLTPMIVLKITRRPLVACVSRQASAGTFRLVNSDQSLYGSALHRDKRLLYRGWKGCLKPRLTDTKVSTNTIV